MSERSASRPGRPKDAAKRAAILTAARRMFARLPYESVTMEDVAAQAGVSKMTVYSHFTDKETLFETIVRLTSDEWVRQMSEPVGEGNLAERLTRTGCIFLRKISDPEVSAMMSMMPATLRQNQALARRFYDAGPGRTKDRLAATIAASVKSGDLLADDAMRAAEDLLSLWAGGICEKLAFGVIEAGAGDDAEDRARRGTEVFLRAYRK